MKSWIKEHPIALALAVSLFLHVVLLILFGFSRQWMILNAAVAEPAKNNEPLVFEMIAPEETAREVIESDAEPGAPPEDAKHISDRNATARNPSAPQDLPIGEAYAQGESPRGDMPVTGNQRSAANRQSPASTEKQSQQSANDGLRPAPAQEFRRELLLNQEAATSAQQSAPPRARYENLQSRAPELGSFSLNTYEWEYAPYLLWLKRRIEQNIYPPPAFTRLGMISGQTELRFRIYPDGRLVALQVLQYAGHKSLMETSVRAVELSVPLKPLPADFPKPYLEVTALFEYLIQGR